MSSTPPPSYESVVNGLKAKLANKTPADLKEVHQILLNLPDSHKKAIVDKASSVTPEPLTPAQKKVAGSAMVQAANTSYAVENMQLTAKAASDAIKKINDIFSSCFQDLSAIDKNFPEAIPAGGFVGNLRPIHDRYLSVVSDSRTLAVKIAVYGERFDSVITRLVLDPNIPDEKKKQKLDDFINTAQEYATSSGDINAKYQALKKDMDIFAGLFKDFALKQETAINIQIDIINEKITQLTKEIGDRRAAMYAIMGVAAAALPVSGVIAAFSGPAAPAIMIIGLIVAGVTAITAVTLTCVINSLEDQKKAKENERDALQGQKQQILDARNKLEDMVKFRFQDFKDNVDVLAGFWLSAKADAEKIKEWIEKGKPDVDIPDYLKLSTDEAVKIYKQMSVYLTNYAKGIDEVITPK